jgi:hypothetical protein
MTQCNVCPDFHMQKGRDAELEYDPLGQRR